MKASIAALASQVRLAASLFVYRVGRTGLAGLCLLMTACAIATFASRLPALLQNTEGLQPLPSRQAESAEPQRHKVAKLLSTDEVGGVLSNIASIAALHGQGWPQAEYRMVPASNQLPASMEITSKFKGSYLDLQKFLISVLRQVPGTGLKAMTVKRQTVQEEMIEADFTLMVFLGSGRIRSDVASDPSGVQR